MPMCMEGRFNREDIAEHLDMPRPPRPLILLTYTTIPVWHLVVAQQIAKAIKIERCES